jgi:hypothetical protein
MDFWSQLTRQATAQFSDMFRDPTFHGAEQVAIGTALFIAIPFEAVPITVVGGVLAAAAISNTLLGSFGQVYSGFAETASQHLQPTLSEQITHPLESALMGTGTDLGKDLVTLLKVGDLGIDIVSLPSASDLEKLSTLTQWLDTGISKATAQGNEASSRIRKKDRF